MGGSCGLCQRGLELNAARLSSRDPVVLACDCARCMEGKGGRVRVEKLQVWHLVHPLAKARRNSS